MRYVVFLTAAFALGAVTAGTASARSAKAASRSVTMHLVEKSVGFNFVDNPPRQGPNAPPLMGDQFAITSDVQSRSGQHVGQLNASCTITRGGVNARAVCYGVYSFEGGQIAALTTLPFTSGNPPLDIAILGGTGVYEGVSGSIHSTSPSENSPLSYDTFHLVWPS